MSEWRTPAQIDADNRLQSAIADMLLAYSEDDEKSKDFMLTEYIVITARVGITDERSQHVKYDYSLSNGSIPWHNMIGLMKWAEKTMMAVMEGSDLDGED